MKLGPVRIETVGETFPYCQVWVCGVRVHHWYIGAIVVAHDYKDMVRQARMAANLARSAGRIGRA